MANVYQRRGLLKEQPCKVLGCLKKAEKHHPDYRKPLEVEWICRKHHLGHHKKHGNQHILVEIDPDLMALEELKRLESVVPEPTRKPIPDRFRLWEPFSLAAERYDPELDEPF